MSPEHGAEQRAAFDRWAEGVIDSLGREFQFQQCSVLLFDSADQLLYLVAQRSSPGPPRREGSEPWIPAVETSISSRVFRTGVAALVPDVMVGGMGDRGSITRSELAVPILVQDRPVGVIAVASARPGAYGIADLEQLRAHAQTAAQRYLAGGFGAFEGTEAGAEELD